MVRDDLDTGKEELEVENHQEYFIGDDTFFGNYHTEVDVPDIAEAMVGEHRTEVYNMHEHVKANSQQDQSVKKTC